VTGPDGLRRVPARIEPHLAAAARGARRGVIVLALDGLAGHAAEKALAHAAVSPLRSTFPSTSATAWLTSVTGLDPAAHGVVGAVYRAPGSDRVTDLISGRSWGYADDLSQPPGDEPPDHEPLDHEPPDQPPGPLVLPAPTVFDRAARLGVRPVAVGRELAGLGGPWAGALLHGADVYHAPSDGEPSIDPAVVVERTVRDVEAVAAGPRGGELADQPVFIWAHVNLDDHIHRAGYDAALMRAVQTLDEAADRWACAGWSVLGHADHGLVPVSPDADLARSWDRFDQPDRCRAPSGGAGRVRWLYPLPGLEQRTAEDLRAALGGHALVLTPDELAERGLLQATPAVRERIGPVVAVAVSPRFPVPDPTLAYEHGADTPDEVQVPFAVWGAL
jgi:Type I phosphodiesterase / nucleotide pyrophosphatase